MISDNNDLYLPDWQSSKNKMVEKYRRLLNELGDIPEAIQMTDTGQHFRFQKLLEIGNLVDKKILDFGCGRADFFPFLQEKIGRVKYTGMDIVPELTETAQEKYPDARILCQDIFEEPLDEVFDYVFISMVLNHNIPNMDIIAKKILKATFSMASLGLGFNFVSSYQSSENPNAVNHDPVELFNFCLNELSTNLKIAHHYERRDVAFFVYK